MSILLVVFYIFGACTIKHTSALMCYECNSQYDSECKSLKTDSKFSLHYTYCTAKNSSFVDTYQKPLCRKIYQRIKVRNNMEVIVRKCGYELHQKKEEDVCYSNRNEDHDEIVCQCFEDGCNSANTKSYNEYLFVLYCIFFLYWCSR